MDESLKPIIPLFHSDWTPPDGFGLGIDPETHALSLAWEPLYIGNVTVMGFPATDAPFHLDLAPQYRPTELRLTRIPTRRQRRLCARGRHPAEVRATWWESNAPDGLAYRFYRSLAICTRCGETTERDYDRALRDGEAR